MRKSAKQLGLDARTKLFKKKFYFNEVETFRKAKIKNNTIMLKTCNKINNC
jgi:hypothetical protein